MSERLLWVIIVEAGEYSDRHDWIGGIFDSKEEAQKVLAIKSAESRQWAINYERWDEKRRHLMEVMGITQSGFNRFNEAELNERLGPPPVEKEIGSRFYLVEAPINAWGMYDYT